MAESLFNIPYWKIQIINFKEKKKELTKLLESYPEEKKWMAGFATNKQSDRSGLVEQFSSIMIDEVEVFVKEFKKDFAITEIWSVSYDKGDHHTSHNHGSVGLTGILYLDLPKDSPVTEYLQPWNNYEDDTTHNAKISIVEGDIIIVPSFILHYSWPNKSNSKKRIISWDMKILEENRYLHRPLNLNVAGSNFVKI